MSTRSPPEEPAYAGRVREAPWLNIRRLDAETREHRADLVLSVRMKGRRFAARRWREPETRWGRPFGLVNHATLIKPIVCSLGTYAWRQIRSTDRI